MPVMGYMVVAPHLALLHQQLLQVLDLGLTSQQISLQLLPSLQANRAAVSGLDGRMDGDLEQIRHQQGLPFGDQWPFPAHSPSQDAHNRELQLHRLWGWEHLQRS